MAITLASIRGISRICRIAAFSGDGLVKALLKLDKAMRSVKEYVEGSYLIDNKST